MNIKKSFVSAAVAVFGLCGMAAPAYRAQLTVQGYAGAGALADFPGPVRISESAIPGFHYADCAEDGADLAPGDGERALLNDEIARLRRDRPEMVYVSFPGDEKSSGGCVAAGRGFFHINSHGGAEPCPFSPYSDVNVKQTSLREALRSPLFTALRDGVLLLDDHAGGCVLYEKRELVERLAAEGSDPRERGSAV